MDGTGGPEVGTAMKLDWLFQWWNAIYSIPLAFVLLFLTITSVVSLLGGAMEGLSHHDASAELGHDVDMDADVDVEADLDLDTDVDVADADVHAGHDQVRCGHGSHAAGHEPGFLVTILVFLGVGRASLILLLQVLMLLWGLIGITLHQAFAAAGPPALLWSVPATLLFSVLGTRAFATLFGRIFKPFETSAVKRNQMVGRTGRVVYSVNADEGTVHIRDEHGTLQRVRARTRQGTLEPGREIIVLGYDPQQSVYEIDDATSFVDRV